MDLKTSNSTSASDVKQTYRSVYSLVKQLDEQKQHITTVAHVFDPQIQLIRLQLTNQCESVIFQNTEIIGRKCREILWRKGYYDLISLAKRLWAKEIVAGDNEYRQYQHEMSDLIFEGISKFKSICVKIERLFDLDLRFYIDFSLLDDFGTDVSEELVNIVNTSTINDEAIEYAHETIHALLLSLGDLHRYYTDFNFEISQISRDFTAKYYFEAFKLNPKIGMAQNQLGTLYSGQQYDLDSTYFYLYSLICQQPFELSENNVAKIFNTNSEYLEKLENDKLEISMRDFVARFILIVDIFFYDKDITDFNSLCHCMLIDLHGLLQTKKLTESVLFKMVSILFFCIIKLKANNSNKVYNLNAFLVAICSELIDSCIINLEAFISDHEKQNDKFQHAYNELFDKFDRNVRLSRDNHRLFTSNEAGKKSVEIKIKIKKHEIDSTKRLTTPPPPPQQQSTADGSPKSSINDGEVVAVAGVRNCSSDGHDTKSDNPKTPSISNKIKRKQLMKRRRRKKMYSDDSDDNSEDFSSNDDLSDFDMDSDFSSNDDSIVSSYSSSDSDSEDIGEVIKIKCASPAESPPSSTTPTIKTNHQEFMAYSDTEDVVIEEEEIIYLNDENSAPSASLINGLINNLSNLNFQSDDDVVFEEECILYNGQSLSSDDNMPAVSMSENLPIGNLLHNLENGKNGSPTTCEKLRYKRKYSKIDPNILIEFAKYERSLKTLKILFDWLKVNNEILVNCFSSNPEFIQKIMKLLNHFNIDIFTRKVFFDRKLIQSKNVRQDLRSLFDVRITLPLAEDVRLKHLSILENVQQGLDWKIPLKMQVTDSEENIMRIFKLVDFGFFMCKMKKFRYNFCARSRRFIEMASRKEQCSNGFIRSEKSRRRNNERRAERRREKFMRRRFEEAERNNVDGKTSRNNHHSKTTNDDGKDIDDTLVAVSKKGYLKYRNNSHRTDSAATATETCADAATKIVLGVVEKENLTNENKYEIMGKLWLRDEVKTLESKISKRPVHNFSPYLVLDSKSLTEHSSIVKNLIKSKKFIILIPSAVLSELDELKKSSEGARNAIRWLEQEFSKGSRFLRSQRLNETLAVPLLKIPKKIDRETLTFLQIAQFCNFIQTNHSDNHAGDVLTMITGDNLYARKSTILSYTGIMNAISVHFEQISMFYAKYKKT